jgi:anthranilate synthase component 2
MRITLIDNYDSFTYNLFHYLGELGASMRVHRNDALSVSELLDEAADAFVISPGPGMPSGAGICLDLIAQLPERMPLLGVCLGHQALGQAFGGRIIRSQTLMHGKTSQIEHERQGLFAGLPTPLEATRYHSLVLDPGQIPAEFHIDARSKDGVIQAIRHRSRPLFGVQFHPESIATQAGKALLDNFLAEAQAQAQGQA